MSVKSALKIKHNGQWVAVPMLQTEGGSSAAGADGGYYTPSVDEDTGILSWSASKEDMPAIPTANVKGDPGTSVTVASVSTSSEDGGSNVVTFSDGTSVTVKNGSKGTKGDTPVKGTDYFTEADKAEMVDAVVAALPKYAGEVETV